MSLLLALCANGAHFRNRRDRVHVTLVLQFLVAVQCSLCVALRSSHGVNDGFVIQYGFSSSFLL